MLAYSTISCDMTHRQISSGLVAQAVIHAAENNRNSLPCENEFASAVKREPRIIEARLRRVQYVCHQLNVKPGATILDIGAGIGLNSVLAKMCGAMEIHAVEYEKSRFDSARMIVQFLQLEDQIHLHMRDVLEMNLPPAEIDAAFSFELLEHIRDTEKLYQNLARWLRMDGKVYARTGANAMNMLNRGRFHKEWDKIDAQNYHQLREKAIREIVKDAPADTIRTLVVRTRGDLLDRVRQVAREYDQMRLIPPAKPPCAPRNPLSGEYMERLLDPFVTKRIMDAQGFRTSLLRPCFKNMAIMNRHISKALRFLGYVIRATHPASLVVAPWLEFLSVRRSSPE